MLNRDQILEALASLEEPYLKKKLVEMQLIRDIMIKDNEIRMSVALSQLEDEHTARLEKEIVDLIQRLDNSQQVYIRFREMTEYERQQAASGNGGAEQRNQGPIRGHGENLDSDLLRPDSGVEFIAIASGKGGVGKSTVTVNLAVALARKGKRVGIIDADIYGFSVPDMMGVDEQPQVVDNKVIPVERYGVKIISMGFFVKDNSPVVWRGPMLGKMLRNFFAEINWGELDVVLLDLPPGTGDIALDIHQMIPQSKEIIVTTPHAPRVLTLS